MQLYCFYFYHLVWWLNLKPYESRRQGYMCHSAPIVVLVSYYYKYCVLFNSIYYLAVYYLIWYNEYYLTVYRILFGSIVLINSILNTIWQYTEYYLTIHWILFNSILDAIWQYTKYYLTVCWILFNSILFQMLHLCLQPFP